MGTEEVQLPPFRHVDDFILASSRFGMPDYQNKERWNNRILQNLLYYQTNYMVVALVAFCFVIIPFIASKNIDSIETALKPWYLYPLETLFGGILVSALLVGIILASQNRGAVQRFKHSYPALVVVLIVGLATLIMYWLGSIAVFVFSIALPMLRDAYPLIVDEKQAECVLSSKVQTAKELKYARR